MERLSALGDRACFALLGPGFSAPDEAHPRAPWQLVTELARAEGDACLWLAPFEAPAAEARAWSGHTRPVELALDVPPARPEVVLEAPHHAAHVAAIREAIAAGDVYQVCLTVRARVAEPSGAALFARLCARGVPRFAAWLRLPDGLEIVSASPELFFAIAGGRVRSEPMKGTAAPDAGDALAASEKDRAELAMITDLVRNDLTPVCRPRTVRVRAARRSLDLGYAVQTVSDVEGELCAGAGLREVLAALHPGGSVTGAPKRAAFDLVRSFEPEPRGPYCGALAFRTLKDRAHEDAERIVASLLIRSAWRRGAGPFTYGVGGGIVYDSDAASERRELEVKLGALGGVLSA